MKPLPRLIGYLVVISVLASACSAQPDEPSASREPMAQGEIAPDRRPSTGRPSKQDGTAETKPRGKGRSDSGARSTADARRGADDPAVSGGDDPAATKPSKKRPAAATATPASDVQRVFEADLVGDPDGSGANPRYMDIERVRLRATRRTFVAALTFAAPLPKRMSDDRTTMLTSVEMKRGGRDLSIYAEGTDQGWRAHTSRSADLPGDLSLSGATLTFRVPRAFVGRTFKWYAHSSWTRSTLLETEYFFDFAPDDQKGRFPGHRR